MIGLKPENERKDKLMKNVLISYVVDAETDLKAVSHVRALMYLLPEHYVAKMEVFDVLDVVEEAQ
jgi:hypothetical protein